MQPDTVIQALAFTGTVPREAIAAASERRDDMIPAFVAEIDRFVDAQSQTDDEIDTSPLFIILHLLGDWRAQAAYPSFCRFLRMDEHVIDHMFGDAQENIAAMAIRLFDGDAAPLEDIILDPSACQFVRNSIFDALVHLAVHGDVERSHVESFVRSAHGRLEPRLDNMVWDSWQNAVAVLALADLAPLAREAITAERVPYFMTSVKHFDEDLQHALNHPEAPFASGREVRMYASALDVVQAFSDLAASQEAWRARASDTPPARPAFGHSGVSGPSVNPVKHLGRNDPCPCGSGKKFKKCCLGVL